VSAHSEVYKALYSRMECGVSSCDASQNFGRTCLFESVDKGNNFLYNFRVHPQGCCGPVTSLNDSFIPAHRFLQFDVGKFIDLCSGVTVVESEPRR
jgi:hypothetical protein